MNLTDHDKAQIEKIKPNTKIRILSEEHFAYIVKILYQSEYYARKMVYGEMFLFARDQCNFVVFKNDSVDLISAESANLFYGSNNEEIFIDLHPKEHKITGSSLSSQNKIKPPFKFRNANLPVVRQWLKDNGYVFTNYTLDILSWNIDAEFGYVDKNGYFSTSSIVKDEGADAYDRSVDFFYSFISFPEIEFDFVIRDIKVDNTTEIAKLESELESLSGKVNEIQAKLSELKS